MLPQMEEAVGKDEGRYKPSGTAASVEPHVVSSEEEDVHYTRDLNESCEVFHWTPVDDMTRRVCAHNEGGLERGGYKVVANCEGMGEGLCSNAAIR